MLTFAYPQFLWTLLLALLPVVWELARRRDDGRLRRGSWWAVLSLHSILIALVCLSLAGPRLRFTDRETATIFLVDRSLSLGGQEAAMENYLSRALENPPAGALAAIVELGEAPSITQPLEEAAALEPRLSEDIEPVAHTNLEQGLELARSLIPAEVQGRIVLLSDGRQTRGDVREMTQDLPAPVEVVRIGQPAQGEVWINNVQRPENLQPGERFDLTAEIFATGATNARVNLYRNRFLESNRQLRLETGSNEVIFENLPAPSGFTSLEVEVLPEVDGLVANNRWEEPLNLQGEPRILIIDPQPVMVSEFEQLLRRKNFQVQVRDPQGLPENLAELQRHDVLVLSSVNAVMISPQQVEAIRRWVVDLGGALIMTGGDDSFGAGGYLASPLAPLLPVRMEKVDREETPAVALMVVLDRSGSMAANVQGQTKLTLAGQGAAMALDILGPDDYFGLNVVDTQSHVVSALAKLQDRGSVRAQLQRLTAGGGGIYVHTALDDAFRELTRVDAKIKHVILFSDASDAEEQVATGTASSGGGESALELAVAMLSNRITLSVVALGFETDRDTDFLRALASRGNGRFYLTSNALNLPQIFTAETVKVATSSILEGAFIMEPDEPHPVTAGIDWAESPLILGYNLFRPDPAAPVLLRSDKGDPLMTTWPYGLGSVTAMAFDINPRWSAELLPWEGFGQLWTQLLRQTARNAAQDRVDISIIEAPQDPETLRVQIDLLEPGGGFRNGLEPRVLGLATATGVSQNLEARQVAPGQYLASLERPRTGNLLVTLSAPGFLEQPVTRVYQQPYPEELRLSGPDDALLQALAAQTGGRFNPPPEDVFATGELPRSTRFHDLTGACLILALLLVPGEIALRRFLGHL